MFPSPEHARFKGKKASPDYSKLFQEAIYKPGVLGNVMFQGKLLPASASFGCFMTLNTDNPAAARIPETYRVCGFTVVSKICFHVYTSWFNLIRLVLS